MTECSAVKEHDEQDRLFGKQNMTEQDEIRQEMREFTDFSVLLFWIWLVVTSLSRIDGS